MILPARKIKSKQKYCSFKTFLPLLRRLFTTYGEHRILKGMTRQHKKVG
jgi:hypothetical protein